MDQGTSDRRQREEERPDPEELLKRYNLRDSDLGTGSLSELGGSVPAGQDSQSPRRGRLRVYLAAAAGSGKTYAMLNEGHRRENRGTDVVVGYVEAHRRPQTEAQLGDLKVIPRPLAEQSASARHARFGHPGSEPTTTG